MSSLVGSYHSRYMPFTDRTVTADFPTPPQPITAHCRSALAWKAFRRNGMLTLYTFITPNMS